MNHKPGERKRSRGENLKEPAELFAQIKQGIKKEWKTAFLTAFLLGLLIHMPVMVSDIPNHDGLDSIYFDQNMITSGRWFLMIACGFSSFFSLPWLIGVLAMLYLAVTAVLLTEILELKHTWSIVLVSGLLVAFPSLASTFAYVFTMDGYMMAVLFAVLAVFLTKKYNRGFLAGAVCLAFSLGIYQAYLGFAVLLSIYCVLIAIIEKETIKEKVQSVCRYLAMGMIGGALYYVILQILLKIQGKTLGTYQGINQMGAGEAAAGGGILSTVKEMYWDFAAFTLKGNALYNNIFSLIALVVLALAVLLVVLGLCFRRKWWKKQSLFVIMILLAAGLPLATNVVLLFSGGVTYHLLMRYQWVLYPILLLAFCERYAKECKAAWLAEWAAFATVLVLTFNYAVTDNIAYSNLEKRYEKTYAYCVRLLDRIEQTEGYYQGIPIAMIGVVGEDEFPVTDVTGDVTAGMIGMGGDSLLYRASNYEAFMKHYLGATLNFVEPERVDEIYYSPEYVEMESFPGATSVKVVDGIMYVKTENADRD